MARITGKAARLSDVAARAGVSKATASNVFNRPKLVREEVRARVLAAAKALGYAGPDPKARVLSAGKANAIGVATAEPLAYFFEDPYSRTLMAGITEACDKHGVGISLVSSADEENLAWSIRSALVDGLILFCLDDADRLIAEARERHLPFVALDFGEVDAEVPAVGVDDRAGAALAARHLAELGHRRFAILSMELGEEHSGRVTADEVAAADYATSRLRVEGSLAALAEFGVDPAQVPVFETTAAPATIDAALAEIFALPEPPTAILAHSDRIAMRALSWLRDHGLPVPGAVSVTGFDGVPEAALSDPPLTTVAQPIREIGRRAVGILLERAEAVRRELLPVELVLRASTAPPSGENGG